MYIYDLIFQTSFPNNENINDITYWIHTLLIFLQIETESHPEITLKETTVFTQLIANIRNTNHKLKFPDSWKKWSKVASTEKKSF